MVGEKRISPKCLRKETVVNCQLSDHISDISLEYIFGAYHTQPDYETPRYSSDPDRPALWIREEAFVREPADLNCTRPSFSHGGE